MLAFVAVLIVGWLVWRKLTSKKYWVRRGVATTPPAPWYRLLSSLNPGFPEICRLYSATSAPVLGFYKGRSPVLMVRDPALVAAIMQVDFHHFNDKRLPSQLDKIEEPLSQHLFGLTGEKWKMVRSKLTPVFSSGKIKDSLPLIEEAVNDLVRSLGSETVDIYPVAVGFVTDVILNYAFGLSREDPNRSEVRKMGLKATQMTYLITLKRAIRFCFPNLFRLLRLRGFDPEVTDFFINFTKAITSQAHNSSSRSREAFINRLGDVAALVPEGERGGLVTAQVFSFFTAGFETTSFSLSTCLYELAKNPSVYAKAREEVDILLKNYGQFSYEAIQEATYLTQVIQETMRIYPPDYATTRICTQPYLLPGTKIVIEKGTEIIIPGFCISRDPQHHKDPMRFDPERFSRENKAGMKPGIYFPFGDGPRKCIAMRFSMVELKYVLARLIADFDLELDPSTPTQLTFDSLSIFTHHTGNILIKFKKRFAQPPGVSDGH